MEEYVLALEDASQSWTTVISIIRCSLCPALLLLHRREALIMPVHGIITDRREEERLKGYRALHRQLELAREVQEQENDDESILSFSDARWEV